MERCVQHWWGIFLVDDFLVLWVCCLWVSFVLVVSWFEVFGFRVSLVFYWFVCWGTFMFGFMSCLLLVAFICFVMSVCGAFVYRIPTA